MKTLTIEDLSKNDEMDRTAMIHVSGGRLPQVMADLIQNVDHYTHADPDPGSPANMLGQIVRQLASGPQ